jgi:hypothetical protein
MLSALSEARALAIGFWSATAVLRQGRLWPSCGARSLPGPVDPARLLVAELADGAFQGGSGAIQPDWDAAGV